MCASYTIIMSRGIIKGKWIKSCVINHTISHVCYFWQFVDHVIILIWDDFFLKTDNVNGTPGYTPRFNEVDRGVYWYHLVRLSVCGQNRVRSVYSTILIGSISYLHILSSNFRRCVACNARFFGKFLKFVTLTLSPFDLGSNMTQWYG